MGKFHTDSSMREDTKIFQAYTDQTPSCHRISWRQYTTRYETQICQILKKLNAEIKQAIKNKIW